MRIKIILHKSHNQTLLRKEIIFFLNSFAIITLIILGKSWLHSLNTIYLLPIFIALFVLILLGSFRVVFHAESLASVLPEPYGTLILTLAVTLIEVMMISGIMLLGSKAPTLARDTIYSVIMILLNGMLGLSLLLGSWRYHEQQYNLQGSKAFLSVILLFSVIGLILPNYTQTTPGPTLSTFQEYLLIISSIGIYIIFLALQTIRHQPFFVEPSTNRKTSFRENPLIKQLKPKPILYHQSKVLIKIHSFWLIAHLFPLLLLTKYIAVPIYYGLKHLNAPPAFGGLIIAILILSPEAMSAIRASLHNQLQRSVNILLGSVLASIVLTIPAVLIMSLLIHTRIILGLNGTSTVLLSLTFAMSIITFGSGRTNVFQGVMHFFLFLVFIILIFD